MSNGADADRVAELARQVVQDHDPKSVPIPEFLGACYDAGLSWVHFPEGMGGLGLSRGLQAVADGILQGAGGPVPLGLNPMGYGMAAPTVREHAQDDDLKKSWLRPLASTEDIWCQLFSEPGAGSDLAGLATSAVPDGDEWVINGQKVWTSLAHRARWGLLLARSNPDVAKHKGLTYFVIDMHGPGVETRPLRQMTGQAEFNEVYFTDARIPDAHRLGAVGNGWGVAMTTLMNERSALGGSGSRRGAGTIAEATSLWASRPDLQTPVLRDRLAQLWLRAEAQRLTSERSRASATVGGPGPEGSIGKMVGAELNQHIYQFCMDLLGPEGILYHGYASGGRDEEAAEADWRGPIQQRFLRSRANTIEGGTSDVMRNILGERILGLPGDLRADAGMPWKEIPRG
jgi:alkylation response protein AidB-like acyl-CoA dehydrogenase